jgi:hypothetical protein
MAQIEIEDGDIFGEAGIREMPYSTIYLLKQ